MTTKLATLAGMPYELKEDIAQYLSPSDLAELALVDKALLLFCRMKLHRSLDLTEEKKLQQWLGDKSKQNSEILSCVRILLCTIEKEYEGNVKEFLESHLPKFPKLTHLTLRVPVLFDRFETPFPFTGTLQVLSLNSCSISFRGLVTLLNQLTNLAQLTLSGIASAVDEKSGGPEPKLSNYLRNLTVSYWNPRDKVVDKLSTLKLGCQELSLNITQNQTAAQNFINGSKDSLRRLDLINTVGSCNKPLTLSACNELRTVKTNLWSIKQVHLDLISSINSRNLRKIIFSSATLDGQVLAGVDDALFCLITRVKVEVIAEFNVREEDHPLDDCETFFKKFLPKFRKVGRVVLTEGQGKGEEEKVVIHDSHVPEISCGCTRSRK